MNVYVEGNVVRAGGFRQNIAIKIELGGYLAVKKNKDTFTCFDGIHERDGQTEKQTDGQTYRTTV